MQKSHFSDSVKTLQRKISEYINVIFIFLQIAWNWRGRAEIARGINLNHWLWNFSKHGTTHIGLLQCLHIIRVCLLLNFVLHTTQFRFLPLRPGKCGCWRAWLEGLEHESWLACCAGLYFQVERRPSITFTRNSKPDKRLLVGMLL